MSDGVGFGDGDGDDDGAGGGPEPIFCRLSYGNFSIIVWFLAIILFMYGAPT